MIAEAIIFSIIIFDALASGVVAAVEVLVVMGWWRGLSVPFWEKREENNLKDQFNTNWKDRI